MLMLSFGRELKNWLKLLYQKHIARRSSILSCWPLCWCCERTWVSILPTWTVTSSELLSTAISPSSARGCFTSWCLLFHHQLWTPAWTTSPSYWQYLSVSASPSTSTTSISKRCFIIRFAIWIREYKILIRDLQKMLRSGLNLFLGFIWMWASLFSISFCFPRSWQNLLVGKVQHL